MLLEQMGSSTGVHLREKGGKEHEVPCHYTLEKNLHEYLAAAEIAADTKDRYSERPAARPARRMRYAHTGG